MLGIIIEILKFDLFNGYMWDDYDDDDADDAERAPKETTATGEPTKEK